MIDAHSSIRVPGSQLIEAAARLAGCSSVKVRALLASLDVDAVAGAGSSLNGDGSPLQLCVSAGVDRRRVRLLVDPAHGDPQPARRLERGLRALRALGNQGYGAGLIRAIADDLSPWLPAPEVLAGELRTGALWLGVELRGGDDAGGDLAAYTSARFGDPDERWTALEGLLGPGFEAQLPRWRALRHACKPASVGFEGRSEQHRRGKLYVRLRRPASLDALGLPELVDERVQYFLARALGESAVPPSGLVLATGVAPVTGELAGAKVDLCGHCVPRSGASWATLVVELQESLGLVPLDLDGILRDGALEMAFLGLGIDPDGAARLNAYLKIASA